MDDGRENVDRDRQNLRRTGGPGMTIGASLRLGDTTPIGSTDKPNSSERTTAPRELSSPTGTNAGRPGFSVPSILAQAIAAGDPAAVEAAVFRGLPRLVKCSLRERRPPHPDPTRTFELVGYFFAGRLSRDDLEESKRLLKLASQPAGREIILRALLKLRLLTSGKSAGDGEEAQLSLQAYAELLSEYPGDAVLDALQAWPRKNKWWPAFAELAAEIEPHCEHRRMLMQALDEEPA
jgi:hypothetical protein